VNLKDFPETIPNSWRNVKTSLNTVRGNQGLGSNACYFWII